MALPQHTTCIRSTASRPVSTSSLPRSQARPSNVLPVFVREQSAILHSGLRARLNRVQQDCTQHLRAAVADEEVCAADDDALERDSCPPQGCLEDLEVADIMTSPALSVSPGDSVYSAMDLMVEKHISGIPVVDEDNVLVGIVSGYDLLALESTPGRLDDTLGFFPPVGRCKQLYGGDNKRMWQEFNSMQSALRNARGQSVGEAMHEAVTVNPDTSIITAANRIVQRKLNRLVVVDSEGKLAGVLSRGDIMRATMAHFRWQMDLEEAAEERGEKPESK